jgi:hypothetical protein
MSAAVEAAVKREFFEDDDPAISGKLATQCSWENRPNPGQVRRLARLTRLCRFANASSSRLSTPLVIPAKRSASRERKKMSAAIY